MKILFLCHRFPFPPDGGGKIRALKMIEQLALSHEVHVVSMVRDEAEAAGVAELSKRCAGVYAPRVTRAGAILGMLRSVLQGHSLSEGYFGSHTVRHEVRRLLSECSFDRIVVHCSAVAQHVEEAVGIPRLLDFCDMDSEKWRMYADSRQAPARWLYRYEQFAVARLERRMAACFDLSTVATPAELEDLLRIATPRDSGWFGNGVDLGHYRPLVGRYDPDQVCFVGRMDYFPNVECVLRFCRESWPDVIASRPHARFVIIGAAPTAEVLALRSVPGVEVTGTVPDVRPMLGRSAVMVAPLRIARGTQNKILEAMAMGVPVVTSTLASRGLDTALAACVLARDHPQEVSRAVVECMSDPTQRRRLSVVARKKMRAHASWRRTLGAFEHMLGAQPKVSE